MIGQIKRVPPQNIHAEMEILGVCLTIPGAITDAMQTITAADFYRTAHQAIFSAMLDLAGANHPVDLVTVAARLSETGQVEACGGVAYLASLADGIPSRANLGHFSRMVRRKSELRQIIVGCGTVIDKCYSEPFDGQDETTLEEVESLVRELTRSRTQSQGTKHISEIIPETMARLNAAAGGGTAGIPTGFDDLDRMLSGLDPADLIIFAARPSMGKTAMAMNMAEHQAVTMSIPVGVISLEMSGPALGARMIYGVSGVDSHRAKIGRLGEQEWARVNSAAKKLSSAPICIDDTPAMSESLIRRKARRMKDQFGIEILYLDYLQLARGDKNSQSREREVAEISGGLKAIAKELNIPVVALSQLNRNLESRTDKRPMLSDLRESGSIEQDADVICFIYRDEVYNKSPDNPRRGIAEVIIGKQRNGPTGIIEVGWDEKTTKFRNLSKR